MSPKELARTARQMIEQDDPALDGVWGRAAALLARQALEGAVRRRLIHEMKLQGHPSFKSQLLSLREIIDDDLAEEVAWTWTMLSRATHHHGYALPPTLGELRGWIAQVDELIAQN